MKKLLAAIVLLCGCLVVAYAFNPSFTIITNEGYLVPVESDIKEALSLDSSDSLALYHAEPDQMIYSTFTKDYMYEDNTTIDMSYPMFTNNGRTLNFLNGEFWLVDESFELYESYDGLYLNNGHTFNADLTIADSVRFILVPLDNGLYINGQEAVYENRLEKTLIPLNSIISFESDQIHFYSFNDGRLVSSTLGQTFDATITIGGSTYAYKDFLSALGLLSDAIEKADKNDDYTDLQEEILEELGGSNAGQSTVTSPDQSKDQSDVLEENNNDDKSNVDKDGNNETDKGENSDKGDNDDSDKDITDVPQPEIDAVYTVRYDANTGIGELPKETEYKQEDTVTVETVGLTKEGYLFDGWLNSFDGESYSEGSTFTMPNQSVVLVAQWEKDDSYIDPATQYKLSYNFNGGDGDIPKSTAHFKDEVITVSNVETIKKGYRFNGWLQSVDRETYYAGDTFTMPSQSVVMVAQWEKIPTYSVNYNLNGATTGVKPDIVYYEENEKVAIVADQFEKTGYKFMGWANNINETIYSPTQTFDMPAKNVVLTAQWTPLPGDKYTVTYLLNEGKGEVPAPTLHEEATNVSVKGIPTKAGFSFDGWLASHNGFTYTDGALFLMPSEDVTLTAQWTELPEKTYEFKYVLNGGSGDVPAPARYTANTSVIVTEATIERIGYIFGGWKRSDTGDFCDAGQTIIMPSNNVRIEAQWDEIIVETYSVTYLADGGIGEVPEKQYYQAGAHVTINGVELTKDGYTFEGWETHEGDLIKVGDTRVIEMPANNITILAKWSKDTTTNPGGDGTGPGGTGTGSGSGGDGDSGLNPEVTAGPGGSGDTTPGTGDPGSTVTPDPNVEPEWGDNDDEIIPGIPGSGSGTVGGGWEGDPPYREPIITISNFNSWIYAISADLSIRDISGAVTKGVTVSAFQKIEDKKTLIETGDNYKVYSGEDGKGANALLRKTYYSTDEIALSILPPDTTIYLQLKYTYNYEFTNENGEKTVTRKTANSDFYEVKTSSIKDTDLHDILFTYDSEFAAYPTSFKLNNLVISNDSDYDPEGTGFENFKKNLLPYISKFTIDVEGIENDATISSSVLNAAQKEEDVRYTAPTGLLESNQYYRFNMQAMDKYGNILPVMINNESYKTYTDGVYTSKVLPSVKITEVENITDKLTIAVTITDEDGTLDPSNPILLQAFDKYGDSPNLYGRDENGNPFGQDSSIQILKLEQPADGKVYTLEIESLEFGKTYEFTATGDYLLQPDNVNDPMLDTIHDALLGKGSFYTAPLTSGSFIVNSQIYETYDYGAKLGFRFNEKSTPDLFYLTDLYRVVLREKETNDIALQYEITKSLLDTVYMDDEGYEYNSEDKTITLYEDEDITVSLYGNKEQFIGKTLWESLMVTSTTDDEGNVEYSFPSQLIISTKTQLEAAKEYTMILESIVLKSGKEFGIPTTLTNTKLITNKSEPIVSLEDVFIAGDVLEFIGLQVSDVDGAILRDGTVEVQLCTGGVVMAKQTIYANEEAGNVRFTGLTAGLPYEINVVALEYNNASGFSNLKINYLLEKYDIIAGSDIQGHITLNSLSYDFKNRTDEPIIAFSGEQIANLIEDSENGVITDIRKMWTQYSATYTDSYWTHFIPYEDVLADGYNVIEVDYRQSVTDWNVDTTTIDNLYIRFYNENYSQIGGYELAEVDSDHPTFIVPEGTIYIRFILSDMDQLTKKGLKVYGYKVDLEKNLIIDQKASTEIDNDKYPCTDDQFPCIIEDKYLDDTYGELVSVSDNRNVAHRIPVKPGQVYLLSSPQDRRIYYYNDQGRFIGATTNIRAWEQWTVPDGASYMSLYFYDHWGMMLYLIDEKADDSGYSVDATVDVYDKKGYLLNENGETTVTLSVEISPAINEPEYTLIETHKIPLKQVDDVYEGLLSYIKTNAEADSTYRLRLYGTYNGQEIQLDEEVFKTNGAYTIINNDEDFQHIYDYPFANFIVTNDIKTSKNVSYTEPFYGTIDFQGHTLTFTNTGYVLGILSETAVIKNAVFVRDNPVITESLIYQNYGTIENVMIKTTQTTTTTWEDTVFLQKNFGILNNFIVELGGDLIFPSGSGHGAIVCRELNAGSKTTNGYVYTLDGADVIVATETNNNDGYRSGGVVQYVAGGATLDNIYSVYDTYGNIDELAPYNGFAIASEVIGSGNVHNAYHVGDFYNYVNKEKTTELFKESRIINPTNKGTIGDIYHVSQNDYDVYATNDTSQRVNITTLHDASWQEARLGDGFEVVSNLEMGFYPRLNLPLTMQKHQIYRYLPVVTEAQMPKLVRDEVEDGAKIDMASGRYTFVFENSKRLKITDFDITGLNVLVTSQGINIDKGNRYEVTAQVSVKEGQDELYTSAYEVNSFTYDNNGTKTTIKVDDYLTTSIEFYKEIKTTDDWAAINDKMTWNYRLTEDLDFKEFEISPASMMINGSRITEGQQTSFTGKIDGGIYDDEGLLIGMHTLANMSLENRNYGYIIYNLDKGAKISNLIVSNLKINTLYGQARDFAGFIGASSRLSYVDNVHIRNSSIYASGRVGALGGTMGAIISNSSVADTHVESNSNKYATKIGGMCGHRDYSVTENVYTNNVTIDATKAGIVEGVGGLDGYEFATSVINAYTNGSISTQSNNAGGVVGYRTHGYGQSKYVYSDVDINSTMSYVGGQAGNAEFSPRNTLSIGNIYAGDANVHRVNGYSGSRYSKEYLMFAYDEQTVNMIESDDIDDANYLLTAQDIASKKVWLDSIQFKEEDWSFDSLAENNLPYLRHSETGKLLWGQTGIQIPGNSGFDIEVIAADVLRGTTDKIYQVQVKLNVADKTYEEIKSLIDSKQITFDIEGMAMSDADYDSDLWDYTISKDSTSESALIVISTKKYNVALTNYMLTFKYGSATTSSMVNYGESLYFTINNIDDWNYYMGSGHGYSFENFEIAGVIDFNNNIPVDRELQLGNLKGTMSNSSFINIRYETNNTNVINSWIKGVSNIDDIDFTNIDMDVEGNTTKQQAALIYMCNGSLSNSKLSNIDLSGLAAKMNGIALFGEIKGNIDNVDIENANVTVKEGAVDKAAVVARTAAGMVKDITVNNVKVDAGDTSYYVGSIVGYLYTRSEDKLEYNGDISIHNVEIIADRVAGAGFGYFNSNGSALKNIEVINAKVTGNKSHIGGFSGEINSCIPKEGTHNNFLVKDSIITSGTTANSGAVGGLAGFMHNNNRLYNVTIDNVDVTGGIIVGGVAGYSAHTGYEDILVIDSNITQHNSVSDNENMIYNGAGGLFGKVHYWASTNAVVRSTNISADYGAGGFSGYSESNYIYDSYIAEDVVITALKGNAGGAIGNTRYMEIKDTALGGTVISQGANVGGVIGNYFAEGTSSNKMVVEGVYVRGSVTGYDNVGGFIGNMAKEYTFVETDIKGLILAADLNSSMSINPVANSTNATFYPGGKITVLKSILYNHQKLSDLFEENPSLKTWEYVGVDQFSNPEFYTEHKMVDIATEHLNEDGNSYMPFIVDSVTKVILPSTNEYHGASAGILLPVENRSDETAVYTSGIDSINIETTKSSVMINDVEYVFKESDKYNKYNVITLGYDFTSTIKVDDITYTADDFKRDVLVNDILWYYIEGDKLMYGGEETRDAQEFKALGNVIHMWQGQLLTSDQKIYELDGAAGVKEMTDKLAPESIMEVARPLFKYSDTLKTYYHFTVENDVMSDYRLIKDGGVRLQVYPSQGLVYDSYHVYTDAKEVKNTYLSVVSDTKDTLISYLTGINTKNIKLDNIEYSSNSLNSSIPISMLKYSDGSIVIFNFVSGLVLCEKGPDETNFFDFAANSIVSFYRAMFSNELIVDNSYSDSEAVLGNYVETLSDVVTTSNGIEVNDEFVSIEDLELEDQEIASVEVLESLPNEITYDVEGGLIIDELTDLPKDVEYVDGVGIYMDGKLTYVVESRVEDTITAMANPDGVENELTQGESPDKTGSMNENTSDTTVDKETHEEGVGGAIDGPSNEKHEGVRLIKISTESVPNQEYSVAYNPFSGKYEVYTAENMKNTETMANSTHNELVDFLKDEEVMVEEKEEGPGSLNISNLLSGQLSDNEETGITIIGLMSAFAALVFAMMYLRLRKSK